MKKLAFIVLLIPLLASCVTEEILHTVDMDQNQTAETSPLFLGPVTYSNPEISGMLSEVGLYAYDTNASNTAVYSHTKFTYSEDLLQPANSDDFKYWKFSEALNVYAYAPYNSSVIQPATNFATATLAISVLANQSSNDNYKNCDLLYGSQSGVTYANWNGGAKGVVFTHRLSKIDINVKRDATLTDADVYNATMEIVSTYTDATLNLKENTLALSSTKKSIIPNSTTTKDGFLKSMQAIILPQAMASQTDILKITRNSQEYLYKLEDDFVFEAGKAYAFDITMTRTEIILNVTETVWVNNNRTEASSKIKYKVGDYYPAPDDPDTAVGVVYQITDGVGYVGKVVSLVAQGQMKWHNVGVSLRVFDSDNDGMANMNKALEIKKGSINDLKSDFTAMGACYKYGEDVGEPGLWYLPAINELIALRTARGDAYFSERLRAIGDPLASLQYHSSTKAIGYVKILHFGNNSSFTQDSNNSNLNVRAVRTFDNR